MIYIKNDILYNTCFKRLAMPVKDKINPCKEVYLAKFITHFISHFMPENVFLVNSAVYITSIYRNTSEINNFLIAHSKLMETLE